MKKDRITYHESITCDRKGCTKVIGSRGYNGRIRWYDGTHQEGHCSACSRRHLDECFSHSKRITHGA